MSLLLSNQINSEEENIYSAHFFKIIYKISKKITKIQNILCRVPEVTIWLIESGNSLRLNY